ncbi:ABC transporter ATP-binding protein [Aquipuribacter hungaricus]|uniref:ABC transporter ATP-binding protein n=1 Tax=Aquipuribacter hungaricus TaxID=545624 RepID=A0ABV7WKZ0_9MICO
MALSSLDPPGVSSRTLPVADAATVRREAAALLRRHRRGFSTVVALYAVVSLAALAAPALLGRLVDGVTAGTLTTADVDRAGLVLVVAVLLQGVFAWLSRRASGVLGERVFAELREGFVDRAVDLPLSTVETAGTGDLVSRTTNDVETLSWVVRLAVPTVFVAGTACVLTLAATVAAGPLVALALLVGVPLVLPVVRWYLRRSRRGYLAERDAYSRVNGGITETVESATTVEHLGLGPVRVARTDADLRRCWAVERYTLALRTRLFPLIDTGYQLPMAVALVWGGWLVSQDLATLGQVTAVTLYLRLLVDPLDELLAWIDQLQVGAACYARVVGVGLVPDDRTASGDVPDGTEVEVRDARYAYGTGPDGSPRDVLHGVDLDLRPGERLAVVGPSGAGKSTLGRLLAGVHPPRTGRVSVGGVPLVDLPLPELRRRVALVTQEHHVFVGTLAENLLLARPEADRAQLEQALAAVDALGWARALPEGLDTEVGSGATPLDHGQAQQLALARLVLADPHTLVLDEATSLLDPRAARHLERSLSAVLTGRTVVAIAHRLHTAHDADRVAVVEGGRVSELGSHDELVARGGSYASLWRSWQVEPGPVTRA